jgi:phosphoribosylglycinamide formyltransferase-1
VKVAGCTVHFVDEGTDTGPIVIQRCVPVEEGDDEEILAARILVEEHRILAEAVRLFLEGKVRLAGRRVEIL